MITVILVLFISIVSTLENRFSILNVYENDSVVVLKEDSINDLDLPFPERDMYKELSSHFQNFKVFDKIGIQDGPDFRMISLVKEEKEILYFKFSPENKLLLDEVVATDSVVSDEYGIKVGSRVSDVIKKRDSDFRVHTDYHQHTYLIDDNSRISYEIDLNFNISDGRLGSIEVSVLEALKNSIIQRIIWSNK